MKQILSIIPYLLIMLSGVGARAANIPYFNIDTTGSEYDRFVVFVNRALAGNPDYGYSPSDAAILYSMTNDTRYADLAVTGVEEQVTQAESLIAAGQNPEVTHDSYLYVGELISSLGLTYDWAYARLTPSQRTRWTAYADQAVYNVWNPTAAKWGNRSAPWSGWSIDNPGNNYYYSFLKATMYWAVASQNQTWLNYLKDIKLPPLVTYFQDLIGGGSMEGTGYGTSHKSLFELYGFWKSAAGTDLSAQSSHCRNSIEYWVNATIPTLDYFAPIGDQARVSDAPLYDYQRALVERAVLLNTGTEAARHGMWWLNHISIRQMSSAFNLKDNIFTLPDAELKPSALSYFAPRLGDIFARTSWDTNATWVHFKAGLFTESHAHEDQGSFSIYRRNWLAVTENIHTHSGIEQGTEVHNIIRFVKDNASIVGQSRNETKPCSLRFQDDGRTLSAQADMANMYLREPLVRGWNRSLTFDRKENIVTLHDSFSVDAAHISAVWQLNTPVQPVVHGDSIVAGGLSVVVLDAATQIHLVEWKTVDSTEFWSGWKIELTKSDNSMRFNVRLRIGSPSSWVANEGASDVAVTGMRSLNLSTAPNPSNGSTAIRFSGLSGNNNTLSILNAQGKIIREFNVGMHSEGVVCWNGRTAAGEAAASGIYFIRMASPEKRSLETRLLLFR